MLRLSNIRHHLATDGSTPQAYTVTDEVREGFKRCCFPQQIA